MWETQGETEKAKIIAGNKGLLKRLADYKSFFKIGPNASWIITQQQVN
jgi:hypothetical protein